MECLDQLLKSLRGDEVMLIAGDGTTAEALIVDMAPAPEIHAGESRAIQAESIAFKYERMMLSSFGATRHPARDNSRANSSSFNLGIYLNLKSVSRPLKARATLSRNSGINDCVNDSGVVKP